MLPTDDGFGLFLFFCFFFLLLPLAFVRQIARLKLVFVTIFRISNGSFAFSVGWLEAFA